MNLVFIIGHSCSGKTTIGKDLEKNNSQIKFFSAGDVIRNGKTPVAKELLSRLRQNTTWQPSMPKELYGVYQEVYHSLKGKKYHLVTDGFLRSIDDLKEHCFTEDQKCALWYIPIAKDIALQRFKNRSRVGSKIENFETRWALDDKRLPALMQATSDLGWLVSKNEDEILKFLLS